MTTHASRLKTLTLICAILIGIAASVKAQPVMRKHTATKAETLAVSPATQSVSGASVKITTNGRTRTITSNGLPTHAVGTFPNSGNPNRISAQSYRFRVALTPTTGPATDLPRGASFGLAINGVPFDPNAAEFWQGNPRSGWEYNALGGAVSLGLDASLAHVQRTGAYHYHGLPVALMQQLGWSASTASPLIGYAADGFPIYALTAQVGGNVVRMTSSYQLKSGNRPGGDAPGGRYDGAFKQDYEYVAGSGRLDECNGAVISTAEYPNGTYAYVLTDAYPTIPRCLRGTMGEGFTKR